MSNTIKLIVSLLLPQLAGFIGSLFTRSGIRTWYNMIEKPALNPPSWIFGPVWTTLYLLMGIALFLIWRIEPTSAKQAINIKIAFWIFGIQLFLNALWSMLFFGLESPALALVGIIFLWIFIVLNIFVFYRISSVSGLLLVPYLIWVSFATYLNYSIWVLNS